MLNLIALIIFIFLANSNVRAESEENLKSTFDGLTLTVNDIEYEGIAYEVMLQLDPSLDSLNSFCQQNCLYLISAKRIENNPKQVRNQFVNGEVFLKKLYYNNNFYQVKMKYLGYINEKQIFKVTEVESLRSTPIGVFSNTPSQLIKNPISSLSLPECEYSFAEDIYFVELNNDQKTDIFIQYLCDSNKYREDYPLMNTCMPRSRGNDSPVPNTLAFFTSDETGKFVLSNEDLFGRKHVQVGGQVGGILSGPRVLNIPGQKLPMINFAISRDDGCRDLPLEGEFTNFYSSQQYIMPDNSGRYQLLSLNGEVGWTTVTNFLPRKNSLPTYQINYWGQKTYSKYFTWQSNDWMDITADYSPYFGDSFFENTIYTYSLDLSKSSSYYSEVSLNPDFIFTGGNAGIKIYKPGDLIPELFTSISDSILFNEYRNVSISEICRDCEGSRIRNAKHIEGKYYFNSMQWAFFFVYKSEVSAEPLIIALAETETLKNDALPVGAKYSKNDVEGITIAVALEYKDGAFNRVALPFPADKINFQGKIRLFGDLNNDGKDDYQEAFGFGSSQVPSIWLNKGNGLLVEADTNNFPSLEINRFCSTKSPNICANPSHGIGVLYDLNQDGFADLIQSEGGWFGSYNWYGSTAPDLLETLRKNSGDLAIFYNLGD